MVEGEANKEQEVEFLLSMFPGKFERELVEHLLSKQPLEQVLENLQEFAEILNVDFSDDEGEQEKDGGEDARESVFSQDNIFSSGHGQE